MIISFKISKHPISSKNISYLHLAHHYQWMNLNKKRECISFEHLNVFVTATRLVQASLRVPLLSPRISSNGFRQPRCMEIGDRSRPWVDRSYTTRCASTAPSLITNPLLIAFKWDDVPWMAAFRVVRKKEEEEVEVSTPRWSKFLLRIVDRSPP